MRNLLELNKYRQIQAELRQYGVTGGENEGIFIVPHRDVQLRIVASSGDGWDHISVSLPDRVPNWYEMEHIKRLFFKDWEMAVEYHMPPKDHINVHPNVLHLWRPQNKRIPIPPEYMV